MTTQDTITGLLDSFVSKHNNVSWKINCCYSDGRNTVINQINIYAQPGDRTIGIISYNVKNGAVCYCMFKKMQITKTENVVDVLLDMMNYSLV